MENESKNRVKQYLIYTDILTVFNLAKDIQWEEIRQNSLFRILYLSTVLYSFRYPSKENPFATYNFSVDPTGPYDSNIASALAFLIKDDYLQRTSGEDVFMLGSNKNKEILQASKDQERFEWLKQVIYILGIYGENKIYDFIFRDPEYQITIKSNTKQSLNTSSENETVKTLQQFQQAFEETLPNRETLTSQTYMELYFEYIFSKILKREE